MLISFGAKWLFYSDAKVAIQYVESQFIKPILEYRIPPIFGALKKIFFFKYLVYKINYFTFVSNYE